MSILAIAQAPRAFGFQTVPRWESEVLTSERHRLPRGGPDEAEAMPARRVETRSEKSRLENCVVKVNSKIQGGTSNG
jgi:hypothetical protein